MNFLHRIAYMIILYFVFGFIIFMVITPLPQYRDMGDEEQAALDLKIRRMCILLAIAVGLLI